MYRFLYRALLSRFDAEQIHLAAVRGLQIAGDFAPMRALLSTAFKPSDLVGFSVRAFGLDFAHPLGLAGGFDKDARCLNGLGALGFSHVEVGTMPPLPQPGNPKPRIFRLTEDAALINRMGFPSAGMDAVARHLSRARGRLVGFPIGISLGKNKATPLDDAAQDYIAVLSRLYPSGDFFVVNVSSPNTPELRILQGRAYLNDLVAALAASRNELAARSGTTKPLLIKISPDLSWVELDDVLDVALIHGIAGIVATNTTLARPDLRSRHRGESGGLSGRPLRARSTEVIRYIHEHTVGRLPIVGVGGIFSGDDLWEKLGAGATLAQAYTGYIYEGPAFVKKCLRRLRHIMAREGVRDLSEIIGGIRPGELTPPADQ